VIVNWAEKSPIHNHRRPVAQQANRVGVVGQCNTGQVEYRSSGAAAHGRRHSGRNTRTAAVFENEGVRIHC
jgi:hypothetical protein